MKKEPWSSAEIKAIKNSNLEESKQSNLEATKKSKFQICDKVAIWSDLDKSVKIKSIRARSSRRPLQRIFWSEESKEFSFYCKRIYRDCNSQINIQNLIIWPQISLSSTQNLCVRMIYIKLRKSKILL